MPLIYDNFPDEVWTRLKSWAKEVARTEEAPSLDQCAAYVELVAKDITGLSHALRPDVVEFYASETAGMIDRFRVDRLQT